MKKLILIIVCMAFVLTGCLRPGAAAIVEDMYRQALLEEEEVFRAFFSEEFLEDNPPDELMEEVLMQVRDVGGLTLLNTAEVRTDDLNEQVREALNARFKDDWQVIVNDADDGNVMVWVVLRTSTRYVIADGEKMTPEAYQNEIRQ